MHEKGIRCIGMCTDPGTVTAILTIAHALEPTPAPYDCASPAPVEVVAVVAIPTPLLFCSAVLFGRSDWASPRGEPHGQGVRDEDLRLATKITC
jgi:hypothetical protein